MSQNLGRKTGVIARGEEQSVPKDDREQGPERLTTTLSVFLTPSVRRNSKTVALTSTSCRPTFSGTMTKGTGKEDVGLMVKTCW